MTLDRMSQCGAQVLISIYLIGVLCIDIVLKAFPTRLLNIFWRNLDQVTYRCLWSQSFARWTRDSITYQDEHRNVPPPENQLSSHVLQQNTPVTEACLTELINTI